jgi:hypothetical protein
VIDNGAAAVGPHTVAPPPVDASSPGDRGASPVTDAPSHGDRVTRDDRVAHDDLLVPDDLVVPDDLLVPDDRPAQDDGRADSESRSRPERRSRRVPPPEPGSRRYLVLACGSDDVTAVDVSSGAMARLRFTWPPERRPDLGPFDVVDAVTAVDPERDDLAHPEAFTVERVSEAVGRLRGRRARRLLRQVVAPVEPHLLGFPGTSAPYWEFRGMRPSVALVAPSQGPLLFRRAPDGSPWARFGWPRSDNWLPVEDRRAIAALWAVQRDRLSGKDLASALGFRPHYLLVALSRPRNGHCYKTIVAFLPRP